MYKRQLAEREAHAEVFASFAALIETLSDAPPLGTPWSAEYVRFELDLLASLGFGLDLARCAATGVNDNLAYVSPKTGRAVSLSAGDAWRDKLLALPPFLLSEAIDQGGAAPDEIAQGLALTGYFLERHVFAPHGQRMPPARTRLVERLVR